MLHLRSSENSVTIRHSEDTQNVDVDSYGLSPTVTNINSTLIQVNVVSVHKQNCLY